jgi:hypothetical protein
LGKRLLERYSWWLFEPHPEWVEPHWGKGDHLKSYVAGIPKEVRVVYFPAFGRGLFKLREIESEVTYRAFYFDPRDGKEYPLGRVVPDEAGEWKPPRPPKIQDWVLVIEKRNI